MSHHIITQFAETGALKAVRAFLRVDHAALARYGAKPPRALLLCGPPGIGKTQAVCISAAEASLPVHVICPGPSICEQLRRAFASSDEPARIVFLDELDAICPSRSASTISTQATALLLSFLDPPLVYSAWRATRPHQTVFVIAATNRPDAVDYALRRPGRFDTELSLPPPSPSERLVVLQALEPSVDVENLRWIAKRAAGFVAADLGAVCKRARQANNDTDFDRPPSAQHLREAFYATTPSVLRDSIAAEVPDCAWEDIGGLDDVKKRLRMAVEWPLRYPQTFQRLGLRPPRGILLHGPPGCSKTTLVRAAASQSCAAFVRLSGADVYSCFLGEAERILRQAFASARAAAPCILFLDEIDAIVGKRGVGGSGGVDGNGVQERVLSALLTEMDGLVSAEGVLVVGATNRVDMLDDALLRPGRFDDILKVGLPDECARLHILQIHSAKLPLAKDVDLMDIARRSIGRSGADLKAVCMEAGLAALREQYDELCSSRTADSSAADGLRIWARHFAI